MAPLLRPICALLLLLATPCHAGNPLVPGAGMADPHIHRFNGSYYMYATHDYSPSNTGFRMDNWTVWSSPDLLSWTLSSILVPQDTPAPPSAYHECWATDGASRGGMYYFYLSLGPDQVGVMASTSPVGPWSDPLGVPLLPASLGSTLTPPTTIRDPCVFADDDGAFYILFGVFNYFIARLGENMTSLAESPQYVSVVNPTGPYGNKTDDKPFLHTAVNAAGVKYYYLSWGAFYGMATSPYGPYNYTGAVIDTNLIDPAFRMNVTNGPWYSWEDYADRHGSFWSENGQWFWSANDRSHSGDAANPSVFRDTVLAYVHYYDNGTMAPVVINATGVGSYLAAHIEAENFMAVDGGARVGHTREGVFGVHGMSSSSELHYPHVRLTGSESSFTVVAANGGEVAVHVLARSGGELVARVPVQPTGGWDVYTHTSVAFKSSASELDLWITLEPQHAARHELLRMDAMHIL